MSTWFNTELAALQIRLKSYVFLKANSKNPNKKKGFNDLSGFPEMSEGEMISNDQLG